MIHLAYIVYMEMLKLNENSEAGLPLINLGVDIHSSGVDFVAAAMVFGLTNLNLSNFSCGEQSLEENQCDFSHRCPNVHHQQRSNVQCQQIERTSGRLQVRESAVSPACNLLYLSVEVLWHLSLSNNSYINITICAHAKMLCGEYFPFFLSVQSSLGSLHSSHTHPLRYDFLHNWEH